MPSEFIKIERSAFMSAVRELNQIEHITSIKANVGYKGKGSVEDTYSLSLSCMASACYQDLVGYSSDLNTDKFDFIQQYKFLDKCPDYKTKEQFEIFIKCRETDIKNINLAINEAKERLKDYK